jgi:hypothetical protein
MGSSGGQFACPLDMRGKWELVEMTNTIHGKEGDALCSGYVLWPNIARFCPKNMRNTIATVFTHTPRILTENSILIEILIKLEHALQILQPI